jgi:hypothetical protein
LGVIAFSGPFGGIDIMGLGGAHPGHFVGCNRHADAGPTDQNPAVAAFLSHLQRHFFSNVGIIHRVGSKGAEIIHFGRHQGLFFKVINQNLFQFKAGMITANCDFHQIFSFKQA